MSNRVVSLLLLVIIAMGVYILWKEPSTHGDMARLKNQVAALPDKAVLAAAKVSNRIEDARIPQKTEKALDHVKAEAKEAKTSIRDDFEDAKRRDRAEQNQTAQ